MSGTTFGVWSSGQSRGWEWRKCVVYLSCLTPQLIPLWAENETSVIRWNYGDAQLGACKETIQGGNHFRYWVQNGPDANRCAGFYSPWFPYWSLALVVQSSWPCHMSCLWIVGLHVPSFYLSSDLFLSVQHDIIPNGYNLARWIFLSNLMDVLLASTEANPLTWLHLFLVLLPVINLSISDGMLIVFRDWLVGNITHSPISTPDVTNTTTFVGTTSWADYTYESNIKYISNLLPNTSYAINHNWTVSAPGINAVDGLVAVIDVKITSRPRSASWVLCHLVMKYIELTSLT